MLAKREVWQYIPCRTGGIAVVSKGEIVAKVIGHLGTAINNEFHIVSQRRLCDIDAVSIVYLSHEERRAPHVAAIDKRRSIQVGMNGRADRVIHRSLYAVRIHRCIMAVG